MKVIIMAVSLLLLVWLEISARRIPTFAGPYRAIVHHVGNKSEDWKNSTGKAWFQLHTTQVRGKQPQFGWGQVYISVPLTDDMKVQVMMASRSNNQWKKNAFLLKFDKICTNSIIYGRSIYDELYGKDYDSNCPVKPFGFKEIKNHSFEFKFPHFPVIPYGRYLFNFAVTQGSETIGVIVADCEAVPKL